MSDFNTPLATTPLTLKLMSLTIALGVGLSCQSEDFDQDTQGRPFIDFISIPGGRVTIGPWRMDITRDVTIKSFQLSKSEVTIGQYRSCVQEGVCTAPCAEGDCESSAERCPWSDGPTDRDEHPVSCVTWAQAKRFASWMNARLPSEAEWEYAARSGRAEYLYPWGAESPGLGCTAELGNFNDCIGETTPVCSYPNGHSEQGVCDLIGNVWEWVEDDGHSQEEGYTGIPADGSAWVDEPRGAERVVRGGSFASDGPQKLQATYRRVRDAGETTHIRGFRLAR